MSKRLILLVMAVLAPLVGAQASLAQQYNGSNTYRDADTIYRVGLTADSDVEVAFPGMTISKTPYADACGVIKLSLGGDYPASLNVNGVAVNLGGASSLSGSARYRCANGVAQYTSFPTNSQGLFRYTNDSGSTTVYLTNTSMTGGANSPKLISYSGGVKRKVKANGCGFVAIRGTSRQPLNSNTQVKIGNDATLTFSAIAQNPNPPVCSNGKTYLSSTNPMTLNGANLYRTNDAVYYVGLAPNSLNVVELNGLESRPIRLDRDAGVTCNYFTYVFRETPSFVKAGAIQSSPASMLSLSSYPNCTNNTLAVNTWYNYYGRLFYRSSDANLKTLTIEYPKVVSRNLPVNSCGFAKIDSFNKANGFNATDKVKINGTEYTVSSLPLSSAPPICRNGVTYQSN